VHLSANSLKMAGTKMYSVNAGTSRRMMLKRLVTGGANSNDSRERVNRQLTV